MEIGGRKGLHTIELVRSAMQEEKRLVPDRKESRTLRRLDNSLISASGAMILRPVFLRPSTDIAEEAA